MFGFLLGVIATLAISALPLPDVISTRDSKGRSPAAQANSEAVKRGSEHPGAAAPVAVRDRQGAAPVHRAITINWVGDTVLGSQYGTPPGDAEAMFASVAPTLRAADLTIGNLEGTLSVGGASKCGASAGGTCFAFQAPPHNAVALRDAGFDVMNLANNHALDFGTPGQHQTIQALDRFHIRHDGLPGSITRVTVKGLRIAIIGFAPYRWATSLTDVPAARTLANQAARTSDIVIAVIHAGAEGSDKTHTPQGPESQFGENRGYARAFAHAVIDGGADLVIGSGPHVIRGMETHRGRLIAYSLGNFAGWHNFGMGGVLNLSGILHVQLGSAGRPLTGRWISVALTGPGLPTLDTSNQSAHLAAQLSADDFGPDAVRIGNSGSLAFPRR